MVNFNKVDGKDVGDVKLYALSTCGWCAKTKAFLKNNDIEYFYVDVDLLPESELQEASKEQRSFNPNGSFPTVVINDTDVIIGYDLDELQKLVQ